MKKYIILAVILLSVFWGFQEGQDTVRPAASKAGSSGASSSVSFPASLREGAAALYEKAAALAGGASSASGEKEAAQDNAPTAPDALPQKENASFLSRWKAYYDFPSALERRIDRSKFVPFEDIPKVMQDAIVAAEDRRFYDHGAVDPVGIARAAWTNYQAGETVEGGSTISQQVVKNLFLSQERTFLRKGEEMVLAMLMERHYTKDQILELYLNTTYLGHGAYGISEASRVYFHKKAEDLTLEEAALLAGLPQAPSAYDPIDHPGEAKKRQRTVLSLMAAQGVISPEDAARAAARPLPVRKGK